MYFLFKKLKIYEYLKKKNIKFKIININKSQNLVKYIYINKKDYKKWTIYIYIFLKNANIKKKINIYLLLFYIYYINF